MHRHATFPVAHAGKFLGILSLEDLKKVPRDQWRARKARDVMRAVNSSMFVRASAAMSSARELMQGNGIGAVAVIDEVGNLIGFMRRPQSK
jgi:CBS domain-containing protein